ncbi:MAG: universal stress protein [Proteobacteria bacterium]|nr:universal stress protein [Pseudomonadota bacterium]
MTEPRRYKIVTAVDLSEMSDVVLETALDSAARHQAPEIHALTVLAPARRYQRRKDTNQSDALDELAAMLRELLGEKLADFDHPFDDLKGWRVYTHARLGEPSQQVVDLAWEAEADLIVLGRHSNTNRRRFIVGSVPQRVLHLARCAVLIAQPTDYERAGEPVESGEQCAECIAIRRDSKGAQWFCARHSDVRLTRSMYMAHHSTTMPIGGGPLL